MTKKRSLKTFFTIGGGSSLSTLSAVCGVGCAGVCGAACLPLCAVPVTSVFGVSSALLSSWMNHLLPVLTALSAVAFTAAYFRIYKKQEADCCNDSNQVKNRAFAPNYSKIFFWIGLIVTAGLYIQAIGKQMQPGTSSSCDVSTCEVLPEEANNNDMQAKIVVQPKVKMNSIVFNTEDRLISDADLGTTSNTQTDIISENKPNSQEVKLDTGKQKRIKNLIQPISKQTLPKLTPDEIQSSTLCCKQPCKNLGACTKPCKKPCPEPKSCSTKKTCASACNNTSKTSCSPTEKKTCSGLNPK